LIHLLKRNRQISFKWDLTVVIDLARAFVPYQINPWFFYLFFISKNSARWIDQKVQIQSGFWSQDLLINQRAMIIRSIS
jgi:hypothetical protein